MKFEKGNKIAKGRPSGSLNRRSVAFFESVQNESFDAAKEMIGIFKKAMVDYELTNNAEDRSGFLKVALDATKEVARYSYPVPKFPDQKSKGPIDDMTPEQKLEALKQAIVLLEAQVKPNGSG